MVLATTSRVDVVDQSTSEQSEEDDRENKIRRPNLERMCDRYPTLRAHDCSPSPITLDQVMNRIGIIEGHLSRFEFTLKTTVRAFHDFVPV
jgi:hypothetical protein